jgi:hypothetical protein
MTRADEVSRRSWSLAGTIKPSEPIAWIAKRVAPRKRIRAGRLVDQIPYRPGKILRRMLTKADPPSHTVTSLNCGAVRPCSVPVARRPGGISCRSPKERVRAARLPCYARLRTWGLAAE